MNNEIRTNENKGFSLVELIVVIAIMAVLVAVLAPALLQYVERSRAQKDDSAMGEVTNAIQLALADQNAYDEALEYTIKTAKSCYVDGNQGDAADTNAKYIETKAAVGSGANAVAVQYMFSDAARKADETPYDLDGNMRGMTITFQTSNIGTSNKMEFKLKDAIINATTTNGAASATETATLENLTADSTDTTMKGQIYNKLRAAIGDTVPVTSQTYRNSDYTVFVRMGTTGGNDASKQDAIKVYGQWGGTNLDA